MNLHLRSFLVLGLSSTVFLGHLSADPDETFTLVAKIEQHLQTSDTAQGADQWLIELVTEQGVGSFNEVIVTGGASPQNLDVEFEASATVGEFRAYYDNKAAFDAAWPSNVTYSFNYSGGALDGTSTQVSLGADLYPTFIGLPGLTGTSWSDAQWYDPSQPLLLTWNGATFANPANALIQLRISDGVHDDFELMLAHDATGFLLPAGTLLSGTQYEGSILFAQIVDGSLNDDFIGAFGVEVVFNLTTVPEPSTYALILGLVALVGLGIRRKLRGAKAA